jgi:hypothetical protein
METLNNTPIPQDAFPVSIDVVGLYSNVPTNKGIAAMRRALDTRQAKTVMIDTIVELVHHVLKFNIFEFNSKLYIQNIGTAMGIKEAPTIVNIFTAEIDDKIKECASIEGKNCIHFYHRYIDDIVIISTGTKDQDHFSKFMEKVNKLHKTIKFTSEFNYDEKSTTCLDTTISIKMTKLRQIFTELKRTKYSIFYQAHVTHLTFSKVSRTH